MNHREPTLVPPGTRGGTCCLLLVLVLALAPERAFATGRHRASGSRPSDGLAAMPVGYLRAVGAPPLRFLEAPSLPDPSNRPPPTAVPEVVDLGPEHDVLIPSLPAPEPTVAVTTEPPPDETSPESSASTPSPRRTPAPILQDDTRPQVRPEDFLPFFQMPGTAAQPGDAVIFGAVPRNAPAPATLPPSSATYNQR